MDAEGRVPVVTLPELVAPDQWQRLQDHFADVLGIGLRTCTADRRLIVNPSWPVGLDIQKLTAVFKLGEELDELLPHGQPPTETTTILRPSGISFSVCPLRASPARVAAYFAGGPIVLGRRETADQLRQRAQMAGTDPSVLWPLMLTIKLYSFGAMRSVLQLLEQVGTTLLQLADEAHRQRPAAPTDMDRTAAAYYTDRVSQSLLEAATAVTGAEGGSVMLFDRARGVLQIRAAQGLPADIIRRTEVPPGEGIAGLAMVRGQVLLVDRDTSDPRLAPLLTRTELVSSLVAPLIAATEKAPVGVLNLRSSDPERRFTTEHIHVLQRLLELAGLALGSLRIAFGPKAV
jgi:hypothetical protein